MIHIHNDATADLIAIKKTEPQAFGRLYALLEQLRANPTWAAKLLDHGYGEDRASPFGVKKWSAAFRVNLPIWRMRAWDLERNGLAYRILYIYNWRDKTYNVMAVVRRAEFDYDNPTDPIRLRVFARCREEFPGA